MSFNLLKTFKNYGLMNAMSLTKFLTLITILTEKWVFPNEPLIRYVFSVQSVTFLFIFVVVFLLIRQLQLPPPNEVNVEGIFGPSSNMILDEIPLSKESDCQCHEFQARPMASGIRKFPKTLVRRSSVLKSLLKGQSSCQDHTPQLIIGHRGAGLNAPENSLSAIRKCAVRGCKMVEFDVCLTKDLVPVLFHDDNLLRITGVDRRISEITWNELKLIDISERFPGEKVPTLEEAVVTCLSLGLRFIIDLKDENDQLVDAIIDIFKRFKDEAYSKGVVSSFYFRVIYKIRARDPQIVGCMAWRPLFFALPPNYKATDTPLTNLWRKLLVKLMYFVNDFAVNYVYWWVLGLSAVLVHKDALNMELVNNLREKGLRVYAWTVNCPVEKKYLLKILQVGYLTDTLDNTDSEEECCDASTSPEQWLCNNNVC